MAEKCSRSVLSCARCRYRKLKCDRQLPACSRCIIAGTECIGVSAKAATEVPRSIVQHLESEIAKLEIELATTGSLDVLGGANTLMQMRDVVQPSPLTQQQPWPSPGPIAEEEKDNDAARNELRKSLLSGRFMQTMITAILPSGSAATGLLSRVRMGMTPSSARVGKNKSSVLSPGASQANFLLHTPMLRSVPPDIVKKLMRKYITTVLPHFPFLDVAVVEYQFETVAQVLQSQTQSQTVGEEPLPVLANLDFLVVYLVLAISVTLGSADRGHETRCMDLSVSLFEEGIQHLYNLATFPSDITYLQTILLVLLYATVFPRSANVWVLSGIAMRSCQELGLHRDPSSFMSLDPKTLDLDRRVFWSAYCMDRSISSALQRPPSMPDAAIDAQCPSQDERNPFLSSITYHQLLSELFHIHFLCDEIPLGMTWDEWVTSMENRLRSWGESAQDQTVQDNDTNQLALARGIMILYRPSPRVPDPPQKSLWLAFEAAATAARIQGQHIASGYFRRPWLAAHHTLEGATTVLFCLRHGLEEIQKRLTPAQIFDLTKQFTSNFLAIASRGWPEVSNYAGVYERLLGPLLDRVFSQGSTVSDRFGPAEDAELARLLHPGPPQLEKLRAGSTRQAQYQDLGSFDFDMFLVSDDDAWSASFLPSLDPEVIQ
ncbi:unnamed protein product [Clonostachys rosea]|uniref:Zn(2)-C6 fungal-type domain-containing protein n=1 Tax=Bionectria ochroleuca TaxID=29856 RepID=A0ABY6TQW7_BIOOC|nr:unnamed protein product [Clonostachys rosea]